jgi:hypothetical protein
VTLTKEGCRVSNSRIVPKRLVAAFSVFGGKNSNEIEGSLDRRMSEICMWRDPC